MKLYQSVISLAGILSLSFLSAGCGDGVSSMDAAYLSNMREERELMRLFEPTPGSTPATFADLENVTLIFKSVRILVRKYSTSTAQEEARLHAIITPSYELQTIDQRGSGHAYTDFFTRIPVGLTQQNTAYRRRRHRSPRSLTIYHGNFSIRSGRLRYSLDSALPENSTRIQTLDASSSADTMSLNQLIVEPLLGENSFEQFTKDAEGNLRFTGRTYRDANGMEFYVSVEYRAIGMTHTLR